MIRKLIAHAADKVAEVLWPLEIRSYSYLAGLNGVSTFEHDSVQLAADQKADEQLAQAEAYREVWEPDELWAAEHMQDGDLNGCLCKKADPVENIKTTLAEIVFEEALTDHMYLPSWGHCACTPRNSVDAEGLGIVVWRRHVAQIAAEKLNNKGKK